MIILFPDGDGAGGNNNAGGEGTEPSIASRILGQTVLHDALNPPAATEPTPPAVPAAPPPWKAETDALAAKQTAMEMENRQLRGIIQGMGRQAPVAPVAPAPATPRPEKTDAQWAEELRTNPTGTLRSFVSELIAPIREEIRGEIQRETGAVRTGVAQNEAVRAAATRETDYINKTYPVKTNVNGHVNEEFHREMEQVYMGIVERDGNRLYPGQLREAAAEVVTQWGLKGRRGRLAPQEPASAMEAPFRPKSEVPLAQRL